MNIQCMSSDTSAHILGTLYTWPLLLVTNVVKQWVECGVWSHIPSPRFIDFDASFNAADWEPREMIRQPEVSHFLTYAKQSIGISPLQTCQLEVSNPMATWENYWGPLKSLSCQLVTVMISPSYAGRDLVIPTVRLCVHASKTLFLWTPYIYITHWTLYHEWGSLCGHHSSLNRLTLTYDHGFNS